MDGCEETDATYILPVHACNLLHHFRLVCRVGTAGVSRGATDSESQKRRPWVDIRSDKGQGKVDLVVDSLHGG